MDNQNLSLTISKDYGAIAKEHGNGEPKEKNGKGSTVSLCSRVFPRGLKDDAKKIINLTWPMTVCHLAISLMGPITLIMAGHIGELELASVALAMSVLNVTGISVMVGLATACDTMMANAYGSANKYLVGVYAQRALYIIPLFCFPCWALHVNSKNILIYLHQDPQVAELVQYYLIVFSPGLLYCPTFILSTFYNHSLPPIISLFTYDWLLQNIVVPNILLGIISNLGNAGLQYVLVFHFDLGVAGCAAGQAGGFLILFLLTLAYIIVFKAYEETWTGFSWKALEDWGLFMKLALAGLIMVAMRWWTFEFGVLMSGMLSTFYLSANSLVFNLENLFYAVPTSFGVAVSVRVGQLLGSGDGIGAKNAARTALLLCLLCFVVEAVIILSTKQYLPYIFTNDSKVASLVSDILYLLTIILGLDSITAITTGVMRAAGRQVFGALARLFGFFLMSLPIAGVFMFILHYGAQGFWYGLIIGTTPITLMYVVLQSILDWDLESIKVVSMMLSHSAQKRVGIDAVTKSVRLDVKSGEYNLRDTGSTPPSKGKLLGERLFLASGFLLVFGAGLVAHFLAPPVLPFASSNSTNATHFSNSPHTILST